MRSTSAGALACLFALSSGCGRIWYDRLADTDGADTGVADTGVADAGVADGGVADTGVAEAGCGSATELDSLLLGHYPVRHWTATTASP